MCILVVAPLKLSLSLGDLLHLRDKQRRGSGHVNGEYTPVVSVEGADRLGGAVDDGRLKPPSLASSNVSMRSEASPTTSSTSERRRHVEINDYAVPADPAPRLLATAETRPLHDLAQRGLVDESIDVEYEIPVGGVRGKANVSLTSVQVDRLGSYHYERTPLDFKRLQDVEQGSPCDDVAWIRFARHPRCAPSS